jgi:hypothetical protein
MAFQFSGTLQDTPLVDIARLLQSTRRTGCLSLTPDGTRGLIYFERGEIVDSQANQLSGVDAIKHLAQFNRGSFEFIDTAISANRTLGEHSTADLISLIEARMMEALQIQELIPQPHEIPHYLGGALPAGFEVSASELAVAMRSAAGNLPIARLAQEFGLDQAMVAYTVARFRAAGLMQMVEGVPGQETGVAQTPGLAKPPPAPNVTPTPGAQPSAGGSQPRYWRGRRID